MKTNLLPYFCLLFLLISKNEIQSQNIPSLAPVFGTSGNIDYQMQATAVGAFAKCHALQPDGKLILGGYNYYSTDNSYITSLLRIDPICGKPDSSFGVNGFVTHVFEQRTICHDIALQQDGKIVGCGLIAPSNAGSQQQASVFRFNSNGSVDSTFNGQGYVKLSLLGTLSSQAHKVFVDAQGKILVVLKGGSIANPSMGVYRFMTNGKLDSTYGKNGQVVVPYGYAPSSEYLSAAMDSDANITMVSMIGIFQGNSFLAVAKIDKNGVRDSSFNLTGYREYPEIVLNNSSLGQKGYDVDLLSDGRFIASIGKNVSSGSSTTLITFLPNGKIDSTFGTDGTFNFAGTAAVSGGIEIDANDRILLFTCKNSNDGPGAVLRLLPNGTLDSIFGTNGLISSSFNPSPTNDFRKFNDGLILPNGDIFAYGSRGGVGFSASRYSFNPALDALPQIVRNGNQLSTSGLGSFQWFFNGVEIAGATANSINIAGDGSYTVSMGFESCTFTSQPFVVATIGIQNVYAKAIEIRNNPTKDYIFIENAPANTSWEVFNIEGKSLLSGTNSTNGKIDLSGIAAGIYIVKCVTEQKVVNNFRIVKQ